MSLPAIVLMGPGQVGLSLFALLKEVYSKPIEVHAVLNSRGQCLDSDLANSLRAGREALRQHSFAPIQESKLLEGPPKVFFDCSSADFEPDFYRRILHAGHSLFVANKSALGSLRQRELFHQGLGFEASVGAHIPVIQTLRNQLASQDQVDSVNGSFSGTLTYLFTSMSAGASFEEALHEAMRQGICEPDPRLDLSGEDALRKCQILARVCGFPVERTRPLKLLSSEDMQISLDEFLSRRLPLLSQQLGQRQAELSASGRVLRVEARVSPTECGLRLDDFDPSSPLGRLQGAGNLFCIRSRRYSKEPLLLEGPGAGVELTAAAVCEDVLRRFPRSWLNRVRVHAAASVGNVAAGFDVLGLSIAGLGDEVELELSAEPGLSIRKIEGDGGRLPVDSRKNTAAVAAWYVWQGLGREEGLSLRLKKALPLNSGLGSSGSSAAAAARAASLLAGTQNEQLELEACLEAEKVASGAHLDNAAASLLGGLVSCLSLDPVKVQRIKVDSRVWLGILIPDLQVPTALAREKLPTHLSIQDCIASMQSLQACITALQTGELTLFHGLARDRIGEAARLDLIYGAARLQEVAFESGLHLAVSGAGPALFTLGFEGCVFEEQMLKLKKAWQELGVDCRLHLGPPDFKGAALV